MTSVRTTRTSSLFFYFFAIPFFLITALALEEMNACAETPIGLAPSNETSLSIPLAVTIPSCGMPVTPMQAPSRSVSVAERIRNCGLRTIAVHHQIYYLEDFWYTLQPPEDQPTLQLTIQRKNAQSTISHQNPLMSKTVL
jgi:hypothetical protein